MDILAHGLWAAAAARFANLKKFSHEKNKINVWLAALFGILPDLLSFGILFAYMFANLLVGNNYFGRMHPEIETAQEGLKTIFSIVNNMYNITHSIIIFAGVIGLIYLWKKKVYLAMFGWLLHILVDIPTHSYKFYPTPFLWPLSEWKFDGFAWGQGWFMALNYGAILAAYILLWGIQRKKDKNKRWKRKK